MPTRHLVCISGVSQTVASLIIRVSQAGLQLACGLTALIIECLVAQSCCHATIGTGGDTGSVCTDPWWFDPGRGGTMPVTGLPAEGCELQSVYTRG
jgi:hypothetical protein